MFKTKIVHLPPLLHGKRNISVLTSPTNQSQRSQIRMLQRKWRSEVEVEVTEVAEEVKVMEEVKVAKHSHRGPNSSQTGKSPAIYPHIA